VYQLTYGEAFDYIEATRRVGAGGLALPQTKLFSRITYPISIFTLVLIGFAVAGKRRRGGKGFFIAFGFVVTILYLVATKMAEPFGTNEVISPLSAAIIPHLLFLAGGLMMLRRAET
jgi:lipopolysaccharide export system permease protein